MTQEPKMKLPIRKEVIALNGDYTGFQFTCRVNPPWGKFCGVLTAMENADPNNLEETLGRLYDIVESVALEWNYVDEDGKKIPFTRQGFRSVPLDLLHLTIKHAREAIEKVPLASSAE